MKIISFFRLKPKRAPRPHWQRKDTRNEDMATLIKDCLIYKNEILQKIPHAPFPQHMCCYLFELKADPGKELCLPIGLLFHLWDNAIEFTGVCPSCGGRIYGYACGGLLSVGGIVGICINCGWDAFQTVGGLGKTWEMVNEYLPITPYKGNSMWFGGAKPNEGIELKILLMNLRYKNAN